MLLGCPQAGGEAFSPALSRLTERGSGRARSGAGLGARGTGRQRGQLRESGSRRLPLAGFGSAAPLVGAGQRALQPIREPAGSAQEL